MKQRILLVVLLAGLALAWRLTNAEHSYYPNLELVTATAVLSAILLPPRWSWIAPFALIAASDYLIGNSLEFVFTWTAWAVTAVGANVLRRTRGVRAVGAAGLFGVAASTWFFLWTNFGYWFLVRGVVYPASWDGLVASYVAGVPFYRTMLLGNLVFVPVAAALAEGVRHRQESPALAGGLRPHPTR